VLAVGIAILGVSKANVAFALVVLAVPPILTNAYVAVDSVDNDAVEAARGMGMKPHQLFAKVELPLALPLTFAGIRTAAVYVVATATLAGFFGGGGLGDIISNQASYELKGVVGAAIVVTVLALATDWALAGVQWLVTPRGLRSETELVGAAAEYEATRTAPETA
jgi:osmoprotectant transport system permease protein